MLGMGPHEGAKTCFLLSRRRGNTPIRHPSLLAVFIENDTGKWLHIRLIIYRLYHLFPGFLNCDQGIGVEYEVMILCFWMIAVA